MLTRDEMRGIFEDMQMPWEIFFLRDLACQI